MGKKNLIVSYESNGDIEFLNLKNYDRMGKIDFEFKKSSSFAMSADLGLVAVGNNQPPYEIAICDANTRSIRGLLKGHAGNYIWHCFLFIED